MKKQNIIPRFIHIDTSLLVPNKINHSVVPLLSDIVNLTYMISFN